MARVSVKGAKRSAVADEKRALRAAVKEAKDKQAAFAMTADSFQNFLLSIGLGTDNPMTASTYGFNPITRNRILLEWIHRGSWLGGMAVDIVAEDMTREGVEIDSTLDPDDLDAIAEQADGLGIWEDMCDAIKWSRLYGGALVVLQIEGQPLNTPLRLETVGKNQFKGSMVFDRWQVDPSLDDLVTEPGPSLGKPKYYRISANAPAMRGQTVHYTRCLRLEGVKLPYNQRLMENLWGLSYIERMFDRMVGFDASTQGAIQLVQKSFLRTLKLKDLRTALAAGGAAAAGVTKMVSTMRALQQNEGITMIDAEDEFQLDQASGYAGISDIILRLGEQLSGALQIPLVRMFGQSPAGLSATGESDLRTYYDGIKQKQKRDLKLYVLKVYRCIMQSMGLRVPEGFGVSFKSLWQLTEKERAETGQAYATAVDTALAGGVIDKPTAMKELRQSSRVTGVFSNINDEMIAEAEEEAKLVPPPGPEDPEAAATASGEGRRAAEGAAEAESGEKEPPASARPNTPPGKEKGGEKEGKEPAQDRRGFRLTSSDATMTRWKITYTEADVPDHEFSQVVSAPNEDEAKRKFRRSSTAYTRVTGIEKLPPAKDMAYPHFDGLDIVLETRKGEMRKGGRGDRAWEVRMPADYGFIRGTGSMEGRDEQMDAFIGPDPNSKTVWVILQKNLDTGEADEHKCMIGFKSSAEAADCYLAAYNDGRGRDRIMRVDEMSMPAFKQWLADNWKAAS